MILRVVCLVISFIFCASASSITVLDSTNLHSQILAHPKSLVMFESPWCPQCQEGMPVLEKLTDEKKDLFVARLDCETRETNDLCTDEKVEAYPTVRLYKNDKTYVDFPDDITKEKISKFLEDPEGYPKLMEEAEKEAEKKKIPDRALELEALQVDLNQYQAFVTVEKNLFILYYAPWCPRSSRLIDIIKKMKPQLAEMNLKLATCNCDYESHRELCREKMTHVPMIEIFVNGGQVIHSEKFFEDVTDWSEEQVQVLLDTIKGKGTKSSRDNGKEEDVEEDDDIEDDDKKAPILDDDSDKKAPTAKDEL